MQVVPGGFPRLREQQRIMAERIRDQIRDSAPASIHCAPTGTGKTLAYITGALWSPARRSVILTHTKALQNQILRDFHAEVCDVRGASNFQCQNSWGTCEDGMAIGCSSQTCQYRAQFVRAESFRAVVTNYAMWAYNAQVFGHVDALICDEAHLLDQVITDACSLKLDARESKPVLGCDGFCGPVHSISKKIREALSQSPEYGSSTQDKLRRKRNQEIAAAMIASKSEVVVQRSDSGIVIRTLWPAEWVERLLLKQAKSVVLTSATLGEEYCGQTLGLDQVPYYSYPSPFDPSRAPVYLLPCGRMSHTVSDETLARVFGAACRIAGMRQSTKGIIHTVSYRRARQFVEFARNRFPEQALRMFEDAQGSRVKEEFLQSANGILVSASASTGHDFADDACRWQVVVKAPFADMSDPLVRMRSTQSRSWMEISMLDALVQMCGRNVRHEDDYGETFIVDTVACAAMESHLRRMPEWVKSRVRKLSAVSAIPKEENVCPSV